MNTKETFKIEGLAGEKTLKGSVRINGAKNAALKAMAAAVLFDGPVKLENVPNTDDIHTLSEILRKMGAKVSWISDSGSRVHVMEIDPNAIHLTDIDAELAKSMRGSVVLTGPMLARFGKVTFPAPGGCVIGTRPVDLFLEGYKKMGASVAEADCLYTIKADKKLRGAEMFFNKVTVGGTETLMMAAVLAKGMTTLKNCAMEPEIVSVAEWLNQCGAKISGAGTPTIVIEGTDGKLLSPIVSYQTIPDRIEAGSFLILGALCAKEMVIEGARADHLEALIALLIGSGVEIEVKEKSGVNANASEIRIVKNTKPNAAFKSIADLRTHEYPGFATDVQAPMSVFLTQVTGESKVFETIYEGRFKYVTDLVSMGADITVMNPREILIKGPASLKQLPDDEELTAYDIRAGFAIVLAALLGKGKFTVNNVHLIDRGYEKLEERLQKLGAKVERVVG